MDLWVLRTVLAQLKDQLKLLEDYDSFSINISVHSMLNPDFANNVFHELVLASVPAERICFELDERSATSYPGPVHAFAKAAKAAGARLALDQCRGALGLEPLRGIPPDLIKIHEGVVRRAVSDPLDRAHLEWLVSASRVLGCKSVACGVEDAATVRMLENIGVDYAQGTMLNKLGPLLV
jgi:EAL domain-containing protein (putative c-di-GMP-specific phosphodiesterase class I)